jgi:hypothetical protein
VEALIRVLDDLMRGRLTVRYELAGFPAERTCTKHERCGEAAGHAGRCVLVIPFVTSDPDGEGP